MRLVQLIKEVYMEVVGAIFWFIILLACINSADERLGEKNPSNLNMLKVLFSGFCVWLFFFGTWKLVYWLNSLI